MCLMIWMLLFMLEQSDSLTAISLWFNILWDVPLFIVFYVVVVCIDIYV